MALMLAFVLLANQAGSLSFADFAAAMRALPLPEQCFVALLLLVGFGAKLGLLPFYEWFPGAYGAGSGATGAFLSGLVLNAAFFSLSRCLLEWLPTSPGWPVSLPGIFVVVAAVAQRDSHGALRLPGGRMARVAEPFVGGERIDSGLSARRRVDVPPGWARRPRGPRLDRRAHPSGGPRARERGDVPHRGWGLSADRKLRPRPIRIVAAQPLAVRTRRAAGGDEPVGNASASRICQRVVSVSDLLSGVPPGKSGEPSGGGARRRRPGADRRDRLRDFRQGVRDRASRTRARSVGERGPVVERRRRGRPWPSRSRSGRGHADLVVRPRGGGLGDPRLERPSTPCATAGCSCL